jgi:hypothetical protein
MIVNQFDTTTLLHIPQNIVIRGSQRDVVYFG